MSLRGAEKTVRSTFVASSNVVSDLIFALVQLVIRFYQELLILYNKQIKVRALIGQSAVGYLQVNALSE